MPRFFLWNIQGKALQQSIADLAREHAVDIIVLAESTGSAGVLLTALNRDRSTFELCSGIICKSITIFANFQASFMATRSESARVSIRHVSLPARQDILLAAAHLPSKLHHSDDSLIFECANLARMIADEERAVGHKRTILLGDLNVNPFECLTIFRFWQIWIFERDSCAQTTSGPMILENRVWSLQCRY